MKWLRFLLHLISGWMVYSLLLTTVILLRELVTYPQWWKEVQISKVLENVLPVFTEAALALIAGFAIYGLIFLVAGQWKTLKGKKNMTIFLLVFFHVIVMFSFFFTLYFTQSLLQGALIELQPLLAIATIIFGIIPFFQQKLFTL